MRPLRYFLFPALALLAGVLPCSVSAQRLQAVPAPPYEVSEPDGSSLAPVDSIYYDDGDDMAFFFIGLGGTGQPIRIAVRFDTDDQFVLSRVRTFFRTEAATDGNVTVQVYDGSGPNPTFSNLLGQKSFTGLVSPVGSWFYLDLDEIYVFGPGEDFFIVVFFEEAIPFPGGADDGPGTGDYEGRSIYSSNGASWVSLGDIGANGSDDIWLIRAISDDADPLAAEPGADPSAAVSLGQSYPNPAAGRSTVSFTVREAADVRLAVYDVLGREVAVLADGAYTAGLHTATFDAAGLPAGAYLYRLEAGGTVQTQTATVVH